MSVLLLILGLLLFVALVVVHEFGHYIAARHSGVEVEEFGIGFPPRAWGKRLKNGTLLSLNWLPLGGFVKLKGEHDADTAKGSFGAASLPAKTKIMLAGVGMNLLAAWVFLTLLAVVGMPRLIDNQFSIKKDSHVVKQKVLAGYVEPGSPADRAGLRARDTLVSITTRQGQSYVIKTSEELSRATNANAGETVRIAFARSGQLKTATVQLRSREQVGSDKNKGFLGVAPVQYRIDRYTWSAPIEAAGVIGQFTKLTFAGIGHALGGLFSGNTARATEQVSGPVGIVVILKEGSLLGYQFVLMIIAVISLTLAIMNVLPIPALDGGRLFVTLAFRAVKKPLTKRREEWIHGTGFALLMLLFVLITFVDIRRFF